LVVRHPYLSEFLVLTPSALEPVEAPMATSRERAYMSIQSSSSPLLFSQQSQSPSVLIFSILPFSS
jgi:hypothetical protein